jgi:DNA replication and repair protein RecF
MISSLRLQNFRSYKDSSFEFESGVNIIVGPNASGKTNLLEAVLVLARGNSYKAKDTDLVSFDAEWARLDGYFGESERILKIKRDRDVVTKEFVVDGKNFKRLSLERTLPSVFFEPNHLQLIVRGPQQRREFIDDMLQRSQVGYKKLSNSYARALSQRNALLKQDPARARSQLFAWDVRLSELGGEIVSSRLSLIEKINKKLSDIYSNIAHHSSRTDLSYVSPIRPDNYSSQMLSKLQSSISEDFAKGFTSFGPHREDIGFNLNKQPILLSASRGEIRSMLLALKVYELMLIEKTSGQRPIFLLDDVFSELDGARRRALVDYLKNHQTIITTTDADAVVGYFTNDNVIAL